MPTEFLEEPRRLRVEAEIQQAVQRVLDAAGVPGLVADDGLDERRVFCYCPAGEGRRGSGQGLDVAEQGVQASSWSVRSNSRCNCSRLGRWS